MSSHNIAATLAAQQNDLGTTGKALHVPSLGGCMLAWGTTVPTDTTSGYAIGCIFVHTDGGAGTALYVNEGSATSCDFNPIVTT